MKHSIQINVGLNNNPLNEEQIAEYFASFSGYDLCGYYFKDMTFQGEIEPTFVAWLKTDFARQSKIILDFENIASVLNQESIALVTSEMEVLVFNVNYSGEGYRFDPKYFEYFLTNKSKI